MKPGKALLSILLVWLLASDTIGAGETGFRLRRPLRVDRDDRPIDKPKDRAASDMYAILYNTTLRHLSPELAASKKVASLNVNSWDEVPDSSWFTNRIGIKALSFDQIVKGPEGKRPEPAPWRVYRRNDSGYTPKIEILDSTGQRYVLKFDPKGARERNSSAERIGSLIMWAAGYNVPHDTIEYFRPSDLKFDEKSQYRDPFGKSHQFLPSHVEEVLKNLDPMPDGRYRGIASQYLSGGIGPFMFTGRREDDPNDIIPHEHRREIRGMRVIAAWINHVDIKDNQAIDVYQAERRIVKHYVLDLSATLGAYEWPSAPYRVGNEYMLDGAAIGKSFVSLGLWRRPWEVTGKVEHPEVGYFTSDLFEPQTWKPSFPNLAFEQMDDSDGYWGAKIVIAFTDELIHQLVGTGEFSRPEAANYVEKTLRERRDAVARYWLNRVTPLEDMTLKGTAIQFRDLAVQHGLVSGNSREYRFHVENLKGKRLTRDATANAVDIPTLNQLAGQASAQPADTYGRTPLLVVVIEAKKDSKEWALPVEVVIGRSGSSTDLQILQWTHAPR
jgi:hypothetical protein